jgi:hypothetical protein
VRRPHVQGLPWPTTAPPPFMIGWPPAAKATQTGTGGSRTGTVASLGANCG